MRKTPKQLTSKQHANYSAAFLLATVICTAIVVGQGDFAKAAAMIFMFVMGALCASHGARSREQKALEGVENINQIIRDDMDVVYRKYLAEKRNKQGRMN